MTSHLDITLGRSINSRFNDGEINIQLLEPVRDQNVFIIKSFENKNIKLYDRIREYGCRNDLDTNSVRLCMMADILTVGGYLDISKLDMTLEEYKISSIDDMYMKVALLRDLAVKNIRDAVEASML